MNLLFSRLGQVMTLTLHLKADRFKVTDLTWLLPVSAVGDVEEDFEDLCDTLRGFK